MSEWLLLHRNSELTSILFNPSMTSGNSRLKVTTSWDDGHPLDLRVADVLAKYGVQGTFYVPMRNVRPTLNAQQIRNLSSHFEIGAHTVNHTVLTQCSRDQARQEICESKRQIEDITGKPCTVFCFPKGRYHRFHMELVASAGFAAVRTVELFSLSMPYRLNGISVIPTTLQACRQSRFAHLKNAIKRMRGRALVNAMQFSRGKDWEKSAHELIGHWRNAGGVFHLWGHSWEVEEQNQWAQLEGVLSILFECKNVTNFHTNSELCDVSY